MSKAYYKMLWLVVVTIRITNLAAR